MLHERKECRQDKETLLLNFVILKQSADMLIIVATTGSRKTGI
jgi:hypothetical protein